MAAYVMGAISKYFRKFDEGRDACLLGKIV